jgi:hypothetical protein
MNRLALLFALCGCDAVFGLDTPKTHDAGEGSDSGDCPGKVGSYGKNGNAGWFQYCPVAGDVMIIGPTSIKTDDIAMCAAHEMAACLIEGATVTLTGIVTVTGNRPLIIAASTELEIAGTLDVSSSPGGNGPGANSLLCSDAGPGTTAQSGFGGGGGAGGSWHSMGGDGGVGGGVAPAAGGHAATPNDPPAGLRGGCHGADGGRASGGGDAGTGGAGGGAVYLTSPHVVVDATSQIKSVGMFGNGGVSGGIAGTKGSGGGGGGGTGGLIVFDAATLTLPSAGGLIFANGGGGGAGGDPTADGMPGMQSTDPLMAGGGGLSGTGGSGTGGTGAVGGSDAGMGNFGGAGTAHAGGGAGGGGQGVILLFSINPGPTDDPRYSPPFIIE